MNNNPNNNEPIMINQNYQSNIKLQKTKPIVIEKTRALFLINYSLITIALLLIAIGLTYSLTSSQLDNKKVETKTEVYIDGYKYRIEKPLKASVEEGTLLLTEMNQKYRMSLTSVNIGYNYYKNNLNNLKKFYIKNGYRVNSPMSKTINEVEYLTMEMNKDNINYILAITGNTTTSHISIIETTSNLYDYTVLEDVSNVIKSIENKSISNRKIPIEDKLISAAKVLIKK